MMQKAEIHSRELFPKLLNDKGLNGDILEIGTHRADFAEIILRKWSGNHLYCIDPWYNHPEYEEQAQYLWGSGNRDEDFGIAKERLRVTGKKHTMLKGRSKDFVSKFNDNTFDFIYIDGDHSYKAVNYDLNSWWSKVKPGGIVAGHDFICPNEDKGGWGRFIQPAVLEFAKEKDVQVYLIDELENLPWSYYMYKP